MRILIATTHVPFVRGGAETHAEGLRDALQGNGHTVEIVAVPFKWYPAEKILDHMLACRLLDLTEFNGTTVDLLIGLKFPAYLIPHPRKVLWILHQHRTAYELWDHPLGDIIYHPHGAQVRQAIINADKNLIPEARRVFANSENVARRLQTYCGISATPLYHPPPGAELFGTEAAEDYLFFPSRLCQAKRQMLVLEALAQTRLPVRVRFAGAPDVPEFARELESRAKQLGVNDRAKWLGEISEAEKRHQYACSLGVIYPPIDEDYGYVTLEAMLASKPVVSCTDSGGPIEFVAHHETGIIAEPTAEALAAAFDFLWSHRDAAARWGMAGRARYDRSGISWSNVVTKLLAAAT